MTSDTPSLSAASTVRRPCAIKIQNSRSTRREKPHRPGERIFGRCARSAACCRLTTEHLQIEVLRQPIESALVAAARVSPTVLVDPENFHTAKAGRVVDEHPPPLSARTASLAVSHETASASAIRATVRC
jgi:hypothetical protein